MPTPTTQTHSMLQYLQAPVRLRDDDTQTGTFACDAVTYNQPVERGYSWSLGIRPGAFAAQVKDPYRVKVLWQHDSDEPIGRVTGLTDSGVMLKADALLSTHQDVPTALKARALLKEKILEEVSVGFRILRHEVVVEKTEAGQRKETWWVTKGQLMEISIVTFGAQGQSSKVRQVHAETTQENRPARDAAHYRRLLATLRN